MTSGDLTRSQWGRELTRERRGIDQNLRRLLNAEKGVPRRLRQAMAHSLLAGGKRLRPALLLWTWDALAEGRRRAPVSREQVHVAACALEMLHTYSLIHDDLPAMDNDDLRRGRPTCHVAFDEATAILAGDALQALAFALLARSTGPVAGPLTALIADAVGPAGMVGGQQRDLDAEGGRVSLAVVRRIHTDKTARLLMAAVGGGALLAGADPGVVAALEDATRDLGLAFQGADDLLDETATATVLGKSAGKDRDAAKATWVRLEGLTKARARTQRLGRRGLAAMQNTVPPGPHRERLLALAGQLWQREC
jgi:geranylgeranyl pyrophosphate synthase